MNGRVLRSKVVKRGRMRGLGGEKLRVKLRWCKWRKGDSECDTLTVLGERPFAVRLYIYYFIPSLGRIS